MSMSKAYRYKLKLEAIREYKLYQAKREGRERRRKEREERASHHLFNLPNSLPKLAKSNNLS